MLFENDKLEIRSISITRLKHVGGAAVQAGRGAFAPALEIRSISITRLKLRCYIRSTQRIRLEIRSISITRLKQGLISLLSKDAMGDLKSEVSRLRD